MILQLEKSQSQLSTPSIKEASLLLYDGQTTDNSSVVNTPASALFAGLSVSDADKKVPSTENTNLLVALNLNYIPI